VASQKDSIDMTLSFVTVIHEGQHRKLWTATLGGKRVNAIKSTVQRSMKSTETFHNRKGYDKTSNAEPTR